MTTEGRDEEELEDESERDDVETQARAQCEMARSTIVENAPSRPPNTDEPELELELEDEDEFPEATEGGRGVLGEDGGSAGGSPR